MVLISELAILDATRTELHIRSRETYDGLSLSHAPAKRHFRKRAETTSSVS